MRNYTYGITSQLHIKTVLTPLQDIAHTAQDIANRAHPDIYIPDWGYSAGLRTKAEQMHLYAQGRTLNGRIVTNADGVINKSPHQSGRALDFFAYIDGKASYAQHHLAVIAAVHLQAAVQLGHKLAWGGFFTSLFDGPHIELLED